MFFSLQLLTKIIDFFQFFSLQEINFFLQPFFKHFFNFFQPFCNFFQLFYPTFQIFSKQILLFSKYFLKFSFLIVKGVLKFFSSSLWSNVWRVSSFKSNYLSQNSKVAVTQSLTHWPRSGIELPGQLKTWFFELEFEHITRCLRILSRK